MSPSTSSSPCVYNVPVALDALSVHTSGFDPTVGKSLVRQHFRDCKEYILGPISPTDFIERFHSLSPDEPHLLSDRRAFNRVPIRGRTSSDIYEPLVSGHQRHFVKFPNCLQLTALNRRTKYKSRCPGFVFDAPSNSEHRKPHGAKLPHICCYATDNLSLVRATPGVELGYAELFIQVSPDPSRDFFVDPPTDVDDATRQGHDFLTCPEDPDLQRKLHDSLGQHIAHVVEIFARQYRVSVFTISMFGSRARFLRWDRAGCVVSESFDVRDRPDLFCEFLGRFAAASSYGRGHDPTIQMALAEEDVFLDAIKRHAQSQVLPGEDVEKMIRLHYQTGHVVAAQVLHHRFTATTENTRRFLISRPVVTSLTMVGRGTRGYWAVDTTTNTVVFLKDTWRNSLVPEVEGDTLRRLGDLGVRYVPSLIWHGDIPQDMLEQGRFPRESLSFTTIRPNVHSFAAGSDLQSTSSHRFASFPGICQVDGFSVSVSRRYHYRLIMGTVGSPLKTIRGTEELLHATYDVFTGMYYFAQLRSTMFISLCVAMRDALAKDSRLHRDVSVGNIVLVQENGKIRRGYLVDWDASCRVDDSGHALEEGRAVSVSGFLNYVH